MGQLAARPPDPFPRMYSPPEPPAPDRRWPRLLVALAAAVALVLAAGGLYLLLPDGGRERVAPAASGAHEPGERRAAVGGGGEPRPGPEPIRALPPPCGTVATATVRDLIPRATRQQAANQTLSTCTYTADGDPAHWLRLEVHLYPADMPDAVDEARDRFDAEWTKAGNDVLARTVSLAREEGMGDEAYRWFREDQSGATVQGQVTMRVRNAVITVGYSEGAAGPDGARAREDECLRNATRVAREVLRGFR